MKGLTTCLWLDRQAEEAAEFYTALIPNSKIGKVQRYGKAGAEAAERRGDKGITPDTVMTVEFELAGDKFVGLNGGPIFKFSEATSFQIHCEDQAEIDKYWNALTAAGGEASQCGWLKDKFGLSWQILPKNLGKLIENDAAMACMLKMQKLDIAELEKAAAEA